MADHIHIEGLEPYNGDWEFDLGDSPLTTREWGWIKRHAGYLPVDVDEKAFSDPELVTMFGAIALRRHGKIETEEVVRVYESFLDAPFGAQIVLRGERRAKEESEASPPPESSTSSTDTSGPDSTTPSATSEDPPKRSGTLELASSESHRERSAS